MQKTHKYENQVMKYGGFVNTHIAEMIKIVSQKIKMFRRA